MLKEGEKIKIDGGSGIIYYVNRPLECYQVIFANDYQELIPFDRVVNDKTQKSYH